MTSRGGGPGPYRRPAADDDEGPPARGAARFVTWAGALLVLAVGVVVVEGATRGLRTESGVRALTATFEPTLADERVRDLARRFDPRELTMPAAPRLAVAEQTDEGSVFTVEREDGAPSLAGTRGLLVTARRARVDASQLDLGALAAEAPDDVRWIGVVRRGVLEDRYHYATVTVDVDLAHVAIVDLESRRLVARVTIEAAPPATTPSAAARYHLDGDVVRAAIAQALSAR